MPPYHGHAGRESRALPYPGRRPSGTLLAAAPVAAAAAGAPPHREKDRNNERGC